VIASEVQEGRSFDEAVVKSITGGDMITARYLYRESFEFRPQFTLWLAGNSRPAISAHDGGMWRRILLVPFPLTIPERQRDPALNQRLTTDPDSQAANRRLGGARLPGMAGTPPRRPGRRAQSDRRVPRPERPAPRLVSRSLSLRPRGPHAFPCAPR
jgi:hypothetical protein